MPKVSVLMPVYKTNPEYLKATIQSILDQTFKDFEFLILDDCPTDTREDVIKSFKDKRIKYCKNKKNMGITPSRNKLIQMAKGKYLAIMDHDDISLNKRFEKQVQFLDMPDVYDDLHALLPDLKMVQAHGQMPPAQLEKIMSDFTEGAYDVLIATSIIESGLDLPRVNTMIVYRADMFGLAALYQLRGRVGRGKQKAYAYLTTTGNLSENAHKRLEVMQKLDSLGAGFMLASHDLDIRGAGNLLGAEQSGHIREIGVALYQKMLSEAVQSLKNDKSVSVTEDFSPQISVGLPVLIPATYIPELDVRMDLYRRMGDIRTMDEINAMRLELKDRFGLYPEETENLFLTLELKLLARKAHIERLDAGEKGATISFFNNTFPNPAGLIDYIKSQMGTMKIRPDQKVLAIRAWQDTDKRLKGIRDMIQKIADLAGYSSSFGG